MAEQEYYRLNLVVEMQDRMRSALGRTRGTVEKFGQSLQRTRQSAQSLNQAKIEPMMRVRDNLTSQVLKADSLIKRLSLETAAPVISAQDKVSSVVSRMNTALNALDKGKFEAVASMKGPLIDEIVKAKASLAALNGVRAGPVAELRGELFGQLTRAMSEARKLDNFAAEPKVTLMDMVTWKARQVGSTLRNMTSRAWTVTIQAKDEVSKVVNRITGTLSSPLGMVGLGAATLGPGILAANSLSKAISFEAQMSSIKALSGLSAKEMAEMQTLAMKMGADTKYNALEAAQGIEELLKSGLTPAAVRAGGLEAALNLATAGELGLADAAEIMSTALNAFKDDAIKPAEAANILAGTANRSATTVAELRYSLAAVSSVAAGIGMIFRDTNSALGLFALNGLKGSDAGTSLKTMLSNLQPRTKEQIELFRKLGMLTADGANQFFTAEGKLKSLDSIAGTLRNSMKDLTDQQRMAYLETMFGSDAIRAANILYKEGADGVKKFNEEMSKVTALDVAKEKMNNAAGAIEQFQGAIETLQISAMLPFLPTIKRLAEGAAEFSEKMMPKITKATDNAAKKVEGFINRLSEDKAFQKMNWGDKIVYVLDQMMAGMDEWVSGDGGKQAEKVFTKLAEIAMRAWITALGGMAKGSVDALLHGNVTGAAGLAMGASLLGGGMVLRTGLGTGKAAYKGVKLAVGKINARRATGAMESVAATEGRVAAIGTITGKSATATENLFNASVPAHVPAGYKPAGKRFWDNIDLTRVESRDKVVSLQNTGRLRQYNELEKVFSKLPGPGTGILSKIKGIGTESAARRWGCQGNADGRDGRYSRSLWPATSGR